MRLRRTIRLTPGAAMRAAAAAALAGVVLSGGAAQPVPAGRLPGGGSALTARYQAHGRLAAASQQPPFDPQVVAACLNPAIYSSQFFPVSTFIAGYSDLSKLGGSAPVGYPAAGPVNSVGPDEGTLGLGDTTVNNVPYQCAFTTAQLDYNGQREFPPVTATFMGFGVIPVTATVSITQVGPDPVTVVGYQDLDTVFGTSEPLTFVSTAVVSLQVSAVEVNGVPLALEPGCQTGTLESENPSTPGTLEPELILSGGDSLDDPGPLYPPNIFNGGALAGTVIIPPFTGCETPAHENLDALLTASVSSASGAGDYAKMIVGPICTEISVQFCTPSNAPANEPLWTVANGSSFEASALMPIEEHNGSSITTITCPSSISGTAPDTTGPPRGDFGAISFTFGTCSGSDGSTWSVTQNGSLPVDFESYAPSTGTSTGYISDFSLDLAGSNVRDSSTGAMVSCTAVLTGALEVTYTNQGATLEFQTKNQLHTTSASSTCPSPFEAGVLALVRPTYHLLAPGASATPSNLTITSP